MSDAEDTLAWQLKAAGILFRRQFHFANDWTPPRRYVADFEVTQVFSEGTPTGLLTTISSLLVEVDGGSWVAGRHTRGIGFEKDRERDALAMIHGWRVLRVTPAQVDSGIALSWIEQLLGKE